MVAQEKEARRVSRGTEIDDHYAVFAVVDAGLKVGAHQVQLALGQVTDEDRVLNAGSIAFHADGYRTQPFLIPDVVGSQVTAAGHNLVTKGS